MKYQEVLDEIYETFMSVKHLVKGKLDSEVREPNIILGLAKDLQLLPIKSRVLRVTGSKGKGTVARLLATALLKSDIGNVGLLVSPEEMEHTDRIRINSKPIEEDEFVAAYMAIRPALEEKKQELLGAQYLSPSGIFLLIGLEVFRNNNVAHYVLETGRGVKYDEIGNIDSKISIVTSIALEHPTYLGSSVEIIAADKLSIVKSTDMTVISNTIKHYSKFEGDASVVFTSLPDNLSQDLLSPDWLQQDKWLAANGAKCYLGNEQNIEDIFDNLPDTSPSFNQIKFHNGIVYWEALVNRVSLDKQFLNKLLLKHKNICVILSLPDDKDLHGIVDTLKSLGFEKIFHIPLSGTRGYLDYVNTKTSYSDSVLCELDANDHEGLEEIIEELFVKENIDAIYSVGTHTYIRALKYVGKQLVNING